MQNQPTLQFLALDLAQPRQQPFILMDLNETPSAPIDTLDLMDLYQRQRYAHPNGFLHKSDIQTVDYLFDYGDSDSPKPTQAQPIS